MKKKAAVGGIIGGFVLLLAFNNCSSQMSFSKTNKEEASKSAGNGTPYGGKLKPGNYYDPKPAACDDSLNDYIAVSIDQSVQEANLTLVDVCLSSNTRTLNENELSISDDNTVAYQGQLFLHESEPLFSDNSSLVWQCEDPQADTSVFSFVTRIGDSQVEVNYYIYAPGGLLQTATYIAEEQVENENYNYSSESDQRLRVYGENQVGDGFAGDLTTPETFDLGIGEVGLICN